MTYSKRALVDLPLGIAIYPIGLERQALQRTGTWTTPKIEVTYSLPHEMHALTPRGKISLYFICNTSGDGIEEITLRQSVWIEVHADEEYDLQRLIHLYIQPLQNFLTLATTKTNKILELNIYSKRVFFGKEDGSRVETPIQVFFPQRFFEPRRGKLLIPDNMLFTFHDIEGNFQSVFERWFTVSEELDTVCNLFFGVQSMPSLNLENRFLNVVQATETYHRRRMKNELLPKSEHRVLRTKVINQVDADHREWLKGLLAYSNEPRLEQRLTEIIDKVYEVITPLINDKGEFAKKIKDTRNYFTHYDSRLKNKAAKGSELFWLTQTVVYLLQACFLIELGLPTEKCHQLLHRNQAFIFAMAQVAQSRSLSSEM